MSSTAPVDVVSLGAMRGVPRAARFMVSFRFMLWWMAHKMGGKGGHGLHERQLLLVESKAGAGVLSGEKDGPSCVSSVPPARGVRVSGQPRWWRPGRRRASALRPELRRWHACPFFVPLGHRWFPSVCGDGVASSAPFM